MMLTHNKRSQNFVVQDEYFQVDNSAIKHDGFFVNRGKLERTLVSLSHFLL